MEREGFDVTADFLAEVRKAGIALRERGSGFLFKPFSPAALNDVLAVLLGSYLVTFSCWMQGWIPGPAPIVAAASLQCHSQEVLQQAPEEGRWVETACLECDPLVFIWEPGCMHRTLSACASERLF